MKGKRAKRLEEYALFRPSISFPVNEHKNLKFQERIAYEILRVSPTFSTLNHYYDWNNKRLFSFIEGYQYNTGVLSYDETSSLIFLANRNSYMNIKESENLKQITDASPIDSCFGIFQIPGQPKINHYSTKFDRKFATFVFGYLVQKKVTKQDLDYINIINTLLMVEDLERNVSKTLKEVLKT